MLEHAQIEAIVQGYMTALNKQDLEAIMNMYAADATVEDPVGTDAHIGHEAIRSFYQLTTSMDIKAELSGPIRAAGAEVAFPFTIQILSGDAPVKMEIIDVFKFNAEGKVSCMRAFWSPENCTPLS